MMGPKRWSSLSKQVRQSNRFTCQYCGAKEDRSIKFYTHLHEVWEYDEENRIQRLKGFECLCPTCHSVHHWGLSQVRGMDMNMLIRHACKINKCTEEQFNIHIAKSFQDWRRRSNGIEWKLDLGIYEELFN